MSIELRCCGARGHPEKVWMGPRFVCQVTAIEEEENSVKVVRCLTEIEKRIGCQQPSSKKTQTWDTIGHLVLEGRWQC